jgi:hypothetical protein
MKIKDLSKGIHAVSEAIDFISSNTDCDETGIGEEMLSDLHDLMGILSKEIKGKYLKNALAKIRRNKS